MYSIWDKLTHSLLHRNLWENGNGKKILKKNFFISSFSLVFHIHKYECKCGKEKIKFSNTFVFWRKRIFFLFASLPYNPPLCIRERFFLLFTLNDGSFEY